VKADAVFLAPPWGSEENAYRSKFSVLEIEPDIREILKGSANCSSRIMLYLPRNVTFEEIAKLIYE
jgi:uncharacterized protein YjaZ